MNDFNLAKKRLLEARKTLSIVKNGEILFETVFNRISGFFDAIDQLGGRLEGATVADRVVGKAIALLFVYAGIRAVYADVLSRKAKVVLDKHGILSEYKQLVNNVLDFERKSVCPFEKIAVDMSDPEDAYTKLRALL